MRHLIFSDIHGNLEALEAVLRFARAEGVESYLMLGDVVGYGASPEAVIERVRSLAPPVLAVRGNHDKVVCGIEAGFQFHPRARAAVDWTSGQLDEEQLHWLSDLPEGPLPGPGGSVLCHGSPLDEDAYILSTSDAWGVFESGFLEPRQRELVFFGHSHVACAFVLKDDEVDGWLIEGQTHRMELEPGSCYLVNPGSVGQPRDRDPRACCLIWDTVEGRIEWRRVEYDVDSARARILDAGLPPFLAERLARGV